MVEASPFTLSISQLMQANANDTRAPRRYVQCPLDPAHRMPEHRLQWHLLNRCKRAQNAAYLYRCKNDFTHVFLSEFDYNQHAKSCSASLQQIQAEQEAHQQLNSWPTEEEQVPWDQQICWGGVPESTEDTGDAQMAEDTDWAQPQYGASGQEIVYSTVPAQPEYWDTWKQQEEIQEQNKDVQGLTQEIHSFYI